MLSIGGRLTLVKASLSNLPIYFMSLFPMPQGVIEKITRIQRDFLWSGGLEKKSLALVKWEIAQLPRDLGGLNIGSLLGRNLGLLFKWLWRYHEEPQSLWRLTIQAKYGYSECYRMWDFGPLHKGGPWKLICNSIWKNPKAKNLLLTGTRSQVGNGKSTLFWYDRWLDNRILKSEFPSLFRKSARPLATIESMGFWDNGCWCWNPSWSRPLRPREEGQWASLLDDLHQSFFFENQEDRNIWIPHKSGSFSVKSCYLEIIKTDITLNRQVFSKIWKGAIPHRIEVFLWIAVRGRLNTRKKLVALKIIQEAEIFCPLCKDFPEDDMHLFFQCTYSREVWRWWWSIWNVSWVWPSSLGMALEQWSFPTKIKFFKKIWAAVFPIILWSLWKERNGRIFNNISSPSSEVCQLILLRLCWWSKVWEYPFPYSAEEVLRNPRCLRWSGSSPKPIKIPPRVSSTPRQRVEDSGSLTWFIGASANPFNPGLSMGGILLNEAARTLCVFSCPSPLMDSSEVNVLAVHRAIQISINDKDFKHLPMNFEIEDKSAVAWCSRSSGGPNNLSFILSFIRSVSGARLRIAFSHNPNAPKEIDSIMEGKKFFRGSDFVAWG